MSWVLPTSLITTMPVLGVAMAFLWESRSSTPE
jgi:hypothetical protein